MTRDTLRQVLTVIATLATITINALANALPINGQNTGAISDRFQVYFTPAGYVFSIWAVIYLGLIAYSVYQALPAQRENSALRAIAPLYWLGSAANIAWIFLWHYLIFYPTILAMGTLLVTLVLIYLRLDIGRAQASHGMRLLVHVPFSIYLGWITVATIANATALLWLAKWTAFGLSPEVWTAIMLAMALVVAVAVVLTRADVAYSLVLAWAFVGIASKHWGVSVVAASAGIAAVVVAVLAVICAIPEGPLPLKARRSG